MTHPFSTASAPYGVSASAEDFTPLDAPSEDTAVPSPVRAFIVMTSGVVSVTTQKGTDRTFTASEGFMVPCCITHVLAATTADMLLLH